MEWLNKWIVKRYHKLQNTETGVSIKSESINRIGSPGITFSVYRANGGYIVENRKYDLKFDRSDCNLHIITDDKDLGEEIGKIITYESIRG